MDTTQRNGSTAGLVAAAFLALLLILTMFTPLGSYRIDRDLHFGVPNTFDTGLHPQRATTPSVVLHAIARKQDRWATTAIVGALVAAFSMVFVVGLFSRLRGQAPSRASAMLCFAVVGLGAYALSFLMQWRGGIQLAEYFSTQSEVPAITAWLAFRAVVSGLNALGAAFAGTSLFIAGWTVIATNLLNPIAGWVAVIAGILSIVGLFAPNSLGVFLGNIVFAIIWLAWAGSELRKPQQG